MSDRALPPSLLERPAAQAKQIAGRLCLDFANAVGGWQRETSSRGSVEFTVRDDRLRDYEDLVAWAVHAGILSAAQTQALLREAKAHPQAANAAWKRSVRLRGAIHSIAWSLQGKESPADEDLDFLAREAAAGRERQRLARGAANLEWRLPEGPLAVDTLLAPVALSAEDYFTRGDLSRLHACPGDDCGWLFEDTTRNRSRRWCDMGDCGNSSKVRKFRARQARKSRTAS